ncbi:MAG: carboxypeptidase regulatory-like domain-containing protein [Flavobacteriales bacterium]|jgi:hypothetical protein|nr:carboxypeptidase regulatory-like domain-containing protein [Flavobacteriales bacterium]
MRLVSKPMRLLPLLLTVFFALAMAPVHAFQVRVVGSVTDYADRKAMAGARVRVYKDGQKVVERLTGPSGDYSIKLGNQARYTVRVDAPGFQGKCYIIDTNGPEWDKDNRVKDLLVETRLPARKAGIDLSWFDLPMGMARFTPSTGHVSWNGDYGEGSRTGAREVMEQYCAAVGIPYVPETGEGFQVLTSWVGEERR